MSEKVIITSNKLGQIWQALIVRGAGFEIAEKSDVQIDSRYMEVVNIICKDGTVFVCNIDIPYLYENEISWMTFDQVEKCISDSISKYEEHIKNGEKIDSSFLCNYQNLIANASKIREVIRQDLIQDQSQAVELKMK